MRTPLFTVLLILLAAPTVFAQQLTKVDPLFRPSGSIVKKDSGRYYVWYEGSTWHIRTTAPADKLLTFRGAIQVHGGGRISSFRHIGKDKGDHAFINLAKTQISWEFQTSNYSDGVDVKVAARDGVTVSIVLQVGDKNISLENVHIGAKQGRPKRLPLIYPAKPNRSMYRVEAKAPENPYLVYRCDAKDVYQKGQYFYVRDAGGAKRDGGVIDGKVAAGKIGDGLHLLGEASRIRTAAKQSECRTIAFWINCKDWSRKFQLISGNTSDFRGAVVQIVKAGKASLAVGTGEKWIYTKPFELGVTNDKWRHFTLVFGQPGQKFACFVDGKKIHEDIVPADGKIDSVHHWVISTPWGGHAIQGAVDEVMIYERALSDEEIQSLYEWSSEAAAKTRKR